MGLATFVAASIGCALSRDVHTLVGARLVQAVSIAAIAVVPRAIVRDLHSGDKAPHPDTRRALANAPSDATAIVNVIGRVARHRTGCGADHRQQPARVVRMAIERKWGRR